MPEQSSMHFYFDWAKERIDEMDAMLASLEAKASDVQAQTRSKADQLMAELQKQRDEFRDTAARQAQAGEAARQRAKAKLESDWNGFEANLRTYLESVAKQIGQQQRTFQDAAAAQLKAWREAADKIQRDAVDFQSARRADIDAAVQRMKAAASEAEARFQSLSRAGDQSWTALNSALTESRAAFDRATQAAREAFNQAGEQEDKAPRA